MLSPLYVCTAAVPRHYAVPLSGVQLYRDTMLANRRGFFLYQARYTIEVRGCTSAGQGRDRDGAGAGTPLAPPALPESSDRSKSPLPSPPSFSPPSLSE